MLRRILRTAIGSRLQEKNMNLCPHCKAKANPLRLLVMTRCAPYRCTQCGGLSLLLPLHNTLAAILTLVVVVACALIWSRFGFRAAVIGSLVLYVVGVGGCMWFFMRLGPTDKNR